MFGNFFIFLNCEQFNKLIYYIAQDLVRFSLSVKKKEYSLLMIIYIVYINKNNSIHTKIEINFCHYYFFLAQVSHGGKGTFI